jgi:hypothetical protein
MRAREWLPPRRRVNAPGHPTVERAPVPGAIKPRPPCTGPPCCTHRPHRLWCYCCHNCGPTQKSAFFLLTFFRLEHTSVGGRLLSVCHLCLISDPNGMQAAGQAAGNRRAVAVRGATGAPRRVASSNPARQSGIVRAAVGPLPLRARASRPEGVQRGAAGRGGLRRGAQGCPVKQEQPTGVYRWLGGRR